MIIGLVGNKSDLSDWDWKVTEKEAEDFANENGLYFGIVSAKTGDGVKNFFDSIINISLIKDENASIIKHFTKNLEDEEGLTYEFCKEDEKKKVYCERCKSIPLITFSKEQYLNIDIKCNCGKRKNVSIEKYFKSLPSIDSLEINTNCNNHLDKEGIIFCFDCYQFLCDECLQKHNNNHELIKENNLFQKCYYHKYKNTNYYYKKKKFICVFCIIHLIKNINIRIEKLLIEKLEKNDELYSTNISFKNINQIIKDLIHKYEENKKKIYLIKLFRTKDIFQEYKSKFSYLMKLYKTMLSMKSNYHIRIPFP